MRRVPAQATSAHFLEDCQKKYGLSDYKIDGNDIVSEKKESVKGKDGKTKEETVKLRYFQNKDGGLIYISSF